MKSFALLAVALLLPQEKNAAEEMFRKLEEKLLKAETLQVSFKSSLERQRDGKRSSGLLSGSIRLQQGGKARLELEGRIEEPVSQQVVSDGKSTVFLVGDTKTASAASPSLGRDVVLMLARTGGVPAVFETEKNLMMAEIDRRTRELGGKLEPRETDPLKKLRLSQFRTGPSEKIGGRDAGAIQFVVDEAGKKPRQSLVTLWIDSTTYLPLRRRVIVESEGVVIEESYSEFKLDEKIDPAKFELPK